MDASRCGLVLSSAQFISSNSKHVTICEEGVKKGAQIVIKINNK